MNSRCPSSTRVGVFRLGALACVMFGPCSATHAAPASTPAVRVTQITRGPANHFFGYIGQSRTIPWNADGRYILALETTFQDRLPGAGDYAGVCLIDTKDNHRVRVVDRTLGWNPQQGIVAPTSKVPPTHG